MKKGVMKVTKNCFEWPFKMEIVNTLEYTFVYHYFEINFNIKRVILIHLLRTFLTPVAVLRIAFTPPTPPQKRMKNVAKKLNWVLLNVTSKIQTKSIRPMECTLNGRFWVWARGVMDRAPASQLGDPGSNPTSAKNS